MTSILPKRVMRWLRGEEPAPPTTVNIVINEPTRRPEDFAAAVEAAIAASRRRNGR